MALVLFWTIAPTRLTAQSLTQGNIRGTVSDQSGAVVPGATITLHNDATNQTVTRTSNSTGAYEFPFLAPDRYTITVTAPNYQTTARQVSATIGQISTLNVQLPVQTSNQTVTVTAEGGVIQTQSPSLTTTMSNEQ